MNDPMLEQKLRELPALELPETWQREILQKARHEARLASPKPQVWPPWAITLRNLFARNPITASALMTLWILILLFKTGTPIDSSEKALIAHIDPNRPVYLISFQDEIKLADSLQDWTGQPRTPVP